MERSTLHATSCHAFAISASSFLVPSAASRSCCTSSMIGSSKVSFASPSSSADMAAIPPRRAPRPVAKDGRRAPMEKEDERDEGADDAVESAGVL